MYHYESTHSLRINIIVFALDICGMKWRWRTVYISSRWPRCTDCLTASVRRRRLSSTTSFRSHATTTSAASHASCSVSSCRMTGCAPSRSWMCSRLLCRGWKHQCLRRGKPRRPYDAFSAWWDMAWWAPSRWNASTVTLCFLERLAAKCCKWVMVFSLLSVGLRL